MSRVGFTPVEEFLHDAMGLAADSIGRGLVERVSRRHMAELGVETPADYVKRLRGDTTLRQQLIEDLVVPETWFFRDRQPFVLLARLAHERGRPVRVLSMPCSTGEEPYSIALSLLAEGLAPESFSVDAVDISLTALAAAKRATYGAHSFRGDSEQAKKEWFEEAAGGRWRPDARARARVTFHHGNLFTFAPGGRYDFVFCRNLMIYFDAEKQAAAVRRLVELLADDGLLFVGHAEAAVVLREGLAAWPEQRTFAFTRRSVAPVKTSEEVPVKKGVSAPPFAMRKVEPKMAVTALPFADVVLKPERGGAPGGATKESSLAEIQALADGGRLDEAARLAQAHVEKHGPTAAGLYLLAVILDARGDAAGAEAAYRKVLYLEPKHEEALAHLVLLLEKRGAPEAARLRQRARRPSSRGGDA